LSQPDSKTRLILAPLNGEALANAYRIDRETRFLELLYSSIPFTQSPSTKQSTSTSLTLLFYREAHWVYLQLRSRPVSLPLQNLLFDVPGLLGLMLQLDARIPASVT